MKSVIPLALRMHTRVLPFGHWQYERDEASERRIFRVWLSSSRRGKY